MHVPPVDREIDSVLTACKVHEAVGFNPTFNWHADIYHDQLRSSVRDPTTTTLLVEDGGHVTVLTTAFTASPTSDHGTTARPPVVHLVYLVTSPSVQPSSEEITANTMTLITLLEVEMRRRRASITDSRTCRTGERVLSLA